MSRELREAVRKARAQTGLGAGGAPLPRSPNLAEARRHVQDVQRAQHPQLPGQTPLLRRAKGAAYRAPKEPRGAVGGLRVVSGSSPVPRWKALEASYLRGEAGLSCAQGQRRRWDKPHSQDRAAQCFVRRRILEGTGTCTQCTHARSGLATAPGLIVAAVVAQGWSRCAPGRREEP